ncbi:MAG: biotin--[acetyl-CoA-carboxylase] ligase [Flavisolibacter sp.]
MSSSNPIGSPFIELPTVDSTNNYAMGLVRAAMAQHGTAVFAHEQTRGKGQRNRQWASQKDQNIALSLILETGSLPSSQLFILSMAVALAVWRFFNRYVAKDIKIKWPNDLYWRDRKAAGILIENLWQGGAWNFAIAGIGININQTSFAELSSKAVSLKQILNQEFDTVALAKQVCEEMNKSFSLLLKDPSEIISSYSSKLYKLEEEVRLKKDNRIFQARVRGVNTMGQLMVEHGVEEVFNVGEVEWV